MHNSVAVFHVSAQYLDSHAKLSLAGALRRGWGKGGRWGGGCKVAEGEVVRGAGACG